MMIRIMICDDQAIARHGLQMILASAPDLEVIGQASDGQEAIELIPELKPDLVLMDLKMPVMNGIEATAKIRACCPDTKILVLTTFDDDQWLFDALRAGAGDGAGGPGGGGAPVAGRRRPRGGVRVAPPAAKDPRGAGRGGGML